ncbi:unnamed protein product [Caenorhabditis angaria]|uniref:DOMON domain-containing protein n=1 Tax=Caenorhabditis angaria TaxID=860376 RepID=A0A9P1IC47_9PELO|nr:unnamed protein product [Caenorhabditis angaria]
MKLFIISILSIGIVFGSNATNKNRLQITGCLENSKQCLGYPDDCLGNQCKYTYSTIIQGDYMEVEILGDRVHENFYVAAAYSSDDKMGEDYVLFCARNSSREIVDKKNMGVGWNGERAKFSSKTANFIDHEMTKNLKVEYVEIKLDERDRFYCKFRHLVEPIRQLTNGTDKPTILMAVGLMMDGKLAYHANDRNALGQIDLGKKAPRRRSNSVSAFSIISNAIMMLTFIFKML